MTRRHKGLLALLIIVLSSSFGPSLARAERARYNTLQIQDYDQMRARMQKSIKKAQGLVAAQNDPTAPADQEAIEELRLALSTILSRPNQDNMLSKLLPDLRKELSSLNSFEDSLFSVVSDALTAVDNKHLSTVDRATALFILDNFLSEFRPEMPDKDELKKLYIKIQDAKVTVPKDVAKELRMRSMISLQSPSEKAKRLLKTISK